MNGRVGTEAVIFRTSGEFSMVTRCVSEGPSVDSGEIVTCEERGVPRSRFGLPKTHSLTAHPTRPPIDQCGAKNRSGLPDTITFDFCLLTFDLLRSDAT